MKKFQWSSLTLFLLANLAFFVVNGYGLYLNNEIRLGLNEAVARYQTLIATLPPCGSTKIRG